MPVQHTSPPPKQAVILAGGRGTRLGALTADRPKPMIEFHGKPFLTYLVEQLRDEGFERVLMLLGYLPGVVQDYFGNGERWGVAIEYSVTGPDDLTVHRLRTATPLLDEQFLLTYCDNYWPLQIDKLWRRFVESGGEALVTVYANRDGYTKDCVLVDDEQLVRVYDRSRSAPDLQGVEIGYAIVNRSVLDLLPAEDALFEEVVYPELARRGRLAAFVTEHRYYSVGSPERLPITAEFLAREPAVILDRDGVLNERPPRAHYVRSWEEFHWLPGTLEALRLFAASGWRVIVVSNQAGVARGELTGEELVAIHDRLVNEAVLAGGRIDAVYNCPHGWEEGCDCRKPRPGMLFRAQKDFNLDLTRVPFVGDDERDQQAAVAAGCIPIAVTPERSLLDVANELLSAKAPPVESAGRAA